MLFILFHHIQTGATREDLRAAIAPFMQEGRVEGEDNTSEVVAEIRHCQSFFAKTLPGYEALITRFRGNRESEKETTERDERT